MSNDLLKVGDRVVFISRNYPYLKLGTIKCWGGTPEFYWITPFRYFGNETICDEWIYMFSVRKFSELQKELETLSCIT